MRLQFHGPNRFVMFRRLGIGITILFALYLTRLQHVSFLLTPLCNPSLLRHRKFDKLKHAYQACMDEESTTPESSRRLTNAIREVIDHFPTGKSFSFYLVMGSPLKTCKTTTKASQNQELVDAKIYLGGLKCWPALRASFEPIIRDLVSFPQNYHQENY